MKKNVKLVSSFIDDVGIDFYTKLELFNNVNKIHHKARSRKAKELSTKSRLCFQRLNFFNGIV